MKWANAVLIGISIKINLHWRWRHAKPLFCMQLLSFQRPSWYISTQFSSATWPGWKAAFGSPGAQLRKPTAVLSVQAQPTRKSNVKAHIQILHVYFKRQVQIENNIAMTVLLSISTLTVVVPREADPDVVIFGVVHVPDELHICSLVDGHQLCPVWLAVVLGVWPRETLLPVVHIVTVAAVGHPKW